MCPSQRLYADWSLPGVCTQRGSDNVQSQHHCITGRACLCQTLLSVALVGSLVHAITMHNIIN